jgi:ABC-2 type transport system permease protein
MTDVLLLPKRALRTSLREPIALVPNVVISVFFLFVYNAGLSPVADLPGFHGSYLGFILPVAIVSAAVGGAGSAGQALIRDLESGYFTKLLLTPTKRLAIVWGPMIAGAIILVAQVILILVPALFMGLKCQTGPLGLLAVVGATPSSGAWRLPATLSSPPCAPRTRRRHRRLPWPSSR